MSKYSFSEEEYKQEANREFLVAIDLWCKFHNNNELYSKLSDDNKEFIEEVILLFKEQIKNQLNDYNNIRDYIVKNEIDFKVDENEKTK